MLIDHALFMQAQDVLVLLLEVFVGFASFTACLVAVDKLYLFYSLLLYKGLAVLSTHVGAHSPLPTPVETWRQTAEGLCPAANVQRDVCRTAHHRLLVPHGIPV